MVKNRKPQKKELPAKTKPAIDKGSSNLEKRLDDFTKSLSNFLIDMTTLEVNTVVVDHISATKFIAWEVYRDIYPISRAYLQQQSIDESLRDRYLNLRQKLEIEYALLMVDHNSEFFDPKIAANIPEYLPILTQPEADFERFTSRLPNPINPLSNDELFVAQRLLTQSQFLRTLRKLGEIKAILDRQNISLLRKQEQPPTKTINNLQPFNVDQIYAQTVIQLNGDVIHRYSQDLLQHPYKDLIVKIHQEGVVAGEKQWRGLFYFMLEVAKKVVGIKDTHN